MSNNLYMVSFFNIRGEMKLIQPLSLVILFLLVGCGKEDLDEELGCNEESSYTICGKTLNKCDFLEIMNGNLVFVSEFSNKGESSAELAGDMVDSLILNGLDFEKLSEYDINFGDGVYSYSKDGTGISFTLFFNEDFGDFKTGDIIPYNIFSYKTFIDGIKLKISFDGIEYSYNHGPLYDLIDGEISVDGDSIFGFEVSTKLDTDKIAFIVNSKNNYYGGEGYSDDVLTLSMTTLLSGIEDVHNKIQDEGYGFSYDDTIYDSSYFKVRQEFFDSEFLMVKDQLGWFWEGVYESSVIKEDTTLYLTGFTSNRERNHSEYYCDEEHTEYIGKAEEALDLNSGVFTFEDGVQVPYGLFGF